MKIFKILIYYNLIVIQKLLQGFTFVLQGCPAFTCISDLSWFDLYKRELDEFIKDIEIKSNKFDFEPEITAKVLKKGARLYELPISYYGREYAEGKKITWKDGIHAILALVKYRFVD